MRREAKYSLQAVLEGAQFDVVCDPTESLDCSFSRTIVTLPSMQQITM